jgi:hypothetical protein
MMLMVLFLGITVGYAQDSDDFAEEDFAEEKEEIGIFKGIEFNGFLEVEQGLNITGDGPHRQGPESVQLDWIMANRRFRIKTSKTGAKGGVFVKLDFIRDEVIDRTYIDIRELRLQYRLFSWMDISVGRQVSTWGVGDMLFINDLFPKNWNANFSGRDMESMKDSSTSIRATSYFGKWTFDVVYHPKFAPDTTPTGRYFSIFDPNSGSLVANRTPYQEGNPAEQVSNSLKHGEVAASLKTRIGSQEVALYGYTGFFKNPRGMQYEDGYLMPFYPKLSVVGASSEGQIGPGIFTAEVGYYHSREDKDGDNPLIENSSFKYLVGYRMDLSAKLSVGMQFYQERMMDYDAYESSMIMNPYRKKEAHNTYTLRLTYKAQQETLWASVFTYYRPQDNDSFTRIDITKRLDNNFSVTLGAAIFTGKDHYEDREFGMLRHDDNIFVRLKYNF